MYYLVDVARTEYPEGEHTCPGGTDLTTPPIRAEWVATYDNERDAIAHAERLIQDPLATMVMVAAWDNDEDAEITTGNYSSRHCALGARIVEVPYAKSRPISQARWSGQGSRIYHDVEFGPWADDRVSHLTDYAVGGGNWVKYTPEPVIGGRIETRRQRMVPVSELICG